MNRSEHGTENWLDAFSHMLAKPCEDEKAFFDLRRKLGLGVGLDEAGNLIRESRGLAPHLLRP